MRTSRSREPLAADVLEAVLGLVLETEESLQLPEGVGAARLDHSYEGHCVAMLLQFGVVTSPHCARTITALPSERMAPGGGPPDTRRDEEAKTLREELRRRRGCGEVFVWCVRHERGEDAEQAVRDLLAAPPAPLTGASQWDFTIEGTARSSDGGLAHLKVIDAETARQLVAHVLRFDLAYGAECLDASTAASLARSAIELVPEPARWWTNGTVGLPECGHGGGWTPLTDATFDTGVIGVSKDRLLVVWFVDED